MKEKYLYGPIFSRRLGRSLGVDIMPHKTCSLDCIYCECGKTTNLTLKREEYTPTAEIINALQEYLQQSPDLDYITFSGSGEPTMHSGIGKIINFLKEKFPQYKVAVLTNSTLLNNPHVRESIKNADLIVPSLDGVSEKAFQKIDRPHQDVKVQEIISGIQKLQEIFSGEIWLEIFIVPGINDTPAELELFKEVVNRINVTRIQLNSLDRPGIVDWLKPAAQDHLQKIASSLGNVEIV